MYRNQGAETRRGPRAASQPLSAQVLEEHGPCAESCASPHAQAALALTGTGTGTGTASHAGADASTGGHLQRAQREWRWACRVQRLLGGPAAYGERRSHQRAVAVAAASRSQQAAGSICRGVSGGVCLVSRARECRGVGLVCVFALHVGLHVGGTPLLALRRLPFILHTTPAPLPPRPLALAALAFTLALTSPSPSPASLHNTRRLSMSPSQL
jgi:hypothetical protein